MPIRGVPFVVVDTETTGGRASGDRLIEIGAVRVEDGRIVDRFQQLVNPDRTVPGRITWLTGITTSMVHDQPPAADALRAFHGFLGDGVFVAHNLAFDLRILRREQELAGLPPLGSDTLCTLRLARRLLPGLRSRGLSSLTDFFGIRVKRRHRALDDAEATAEVLIRFLDQLEFEFGAQTVEDVLVFQHRRYAELRGLSKNVEYVKENVLGALPRRPGVYFMKDGRGRTIYVGKARNLRDRVRSYFTAVEGHPPRIRRMVRAVRDVEWQITASELEAMLLESQLIKDLQPTYNRAQRRYVNRPFIRINTSHAFPRVSYSAFLHDDGSEYYGPMASRNEAAFVVDVIDRFFLLRECDDDTFARGQRCTYASMGRCSAPCEGGEGAANYGDEVERIRRFLNGDDDSVCDRIESAMRAASAQLDFEQAGIYRDWLAGIGRMLEKRRTIATRVLQHNVVIVHTPSSDGPTRLMAVRRGRHAETLEVGAPLSRSDRAALRNMLTRCYVEGADDLDSYREKEIDELFVLSHWLYTHRDEVRQVRWEEQDCVDSVTERIAGALSPPGMRLANAPRIGWDATDISASESAQLSLVSSTPALPGGASAASRSALT